MIHLKLVFSEGCKVCVQVHSFKCGCPVVPAPFVEDTAFVSLCCLCSLIKDQLLVFMGSNVGLFILFIDLFVCSFFFFPGPHCLDTCGFMASHKFG